MFNVKQSHPGSRNPDGILPEDTPRDDKLPWGPVEIVETGTPLTDKEIEEIWNDLPSPSSSTAENA